MCYLFIINILAILSIIEIHTKVNYSIKVVKIDKIYQYFFVFLPTNYKKDKVMRKEIHPKEYRTVVFKDMSNETAFISKSTIKTKDTIVWEDGNEYPLVKLEISNTSHPFFTGKVKLVDTAGRVDKFRNKYQKHFDKKN